MLSRGGTALYRPAPENPPTNKRSDTDISRENVGGEENLSGEEEQVTYLLRHNDPVCFEMSDFDGNVFQVILFIFVLIFFCFLTIYALLEVL